MPTVNSTLLSNNRIEAPFEAHEFLETLIAIGPPLVSHRLGACWRQGGYRYLAQALAQSEGTTLGEKWQYFERHTWPGWSDRLRRDKDFAKRVAYAPWTAVLTGLVRPRYDWILGQDVLRHLDRLPATHLWRVSENRFAEAMRSLAWVRCAQAQHRALTNAVRILIHQG
jgi:hypothetical protein